MSLKICQVVVVVILGTLMAYENVFYGWLQTSECTGNDTKSQMSLKNYSFIYLSSRTEELSNVRPACCTDNAIEVMDFETRPSYFSTSALSDKSWEIKPACFTSYTDEGVDSPERSAHFASQLLLESMSQMKPACFTSNSFDSDGFEIRTGFLLHWN